MNPSTLLCAPVLALLLAWTPSAVAPAAVSNAAPAPDPAAAARAVDALRLGEHASVIAPRPARPARAARVTRPAAPRPKAQPRPRTVRPVTPSLSPVERARVAFASLRTPLPAGWTIRFRAYRGTYQGITATDTRTVTIWARARDTHQSLRITIAHELGHALDFTTITPADQQRYLALRGRSGFGGTWYPANGTSDYASPAGDFAEVYALWLAGPGDFRSSFAPRPTAAQLQQIGQLFREMRARQP